MSRVKRSSTPSNSFRIYDAALIFPKEFCCLFYYSQEEVLKKREFNLKYFLKLEKLTAECLERKLFFPQLLLLLGLIKIEYTDTIKPFVDICFQVLITIQFPTD